MRRALYSLNVGVALVVVRAASAGGAVVVLDGLHARVGGVERASRSRADTVAVTVLGIWSGGGAEGSQHLNVVCVRKRIQLTSPARRS